MATFALSSPWVIYYREVEEMFKYDSEVHVVFYEEENVIKLYVDDEVKADALTIIMPDEVSFGNVILKIEICPANKNSIKDPLLKDRDTIFEEAFYGNPVFSFAKTIQGILSNSMTYVVFKNQVVQYYNDDLGDVYGQCSTLYQDIAKRIFKGIEGVYYCTDIVDSAKDCWGSKDNGLKIQWP